MKRIVVGIALSILLLGASTAIIGFQTQDEIEKIIEKSNKIYAKYGLKANIEEYKKSFWGAVAKIKIEVLDKSLKEGLVKEYGLSLPISTEYQIEHGPIFFKNSMGIGLSRVHQEIAVNRLFIPKIQKQFTKESNLSSSTVISFSKVANYHVLSEAIEIKEENSLISIAPFEIKGESNLNDFTGEMQMVMPLISMVEGDENLTVESMLLAARMDKFLSDSLSMGDINLTIKRFYLKDSQRGIIEVIPSLEIESHQDGEKSFSSKVALKMDFNNSTSLSSSLPDMERLNMMVKVDGVGVKGMQQYQEAIKRVEEKQTSILINLKKNPNNKEESYQKLVALQQEMAGVFLDSLKDMLFKDKTKITYSFTSQTKDKKESHGEVLLGYTGDIDFSKSPQEIRQKINRDLLNLFKLEMEMSIDEAHIKAFPNADELLKQLKSPMSQTMISYHNGKYEIKGYLKNHELMVNDENLTNTVLPMLQMLSQLGMAQ